LSFLSAASAPEAAPKVIARANTIGVFFIGAMCSR
jgi:hypothetical protein